MEKDKTTIDVLRTTQKKLVSWKYKLNVKSYDEVINRLFNLITKFKLAKEMEAVK